jgi:tetratricopeptide (TPR) repeat protein
MTAYAKAFRHFQAGRFRQAELICRTLVKHDPANASAQHLLGVLAHQAGKHEEAVAALRRAIEIDASNGEYHYNLGVALQVLGRLDAAISSYVSALRQQPGRAEAHNNLGHALLLKNRLDDAQARLAEALRLRPEYPEAMHNRAEAFRRQGRPAQGIPLLKQAFRLRPDFPEAYVTLGRACADLAKVDEARDAFQKALAQQPTCADAHNQLGLVFLHQGQLDEAKRCFTEALRHHPNSADAHNNLGVVLHEQNRHDEAAASFYQALALEPEFASAHNNLGRLCEKRGRLDEAAARFRLALCYQPGNAVFHNNLGNALTLRSYAEEALRSYQQAVRLQPAEPVYHSNLANAFLLMGRPEDAEASCRLALRVRPDHVDARHNLAISLASQGKFDEALTHNAEALRLDPEHAGARNCRALWWLQAGDFARGWPEYEWRWKVRGVKPREFAEPTWDGAPLAGRTILLYAEQALGDSIQFIRYAPLIKARGGQVIVECQRLLARLLHTCAGIDQIVPRGSALPHFDVQAALLSLPGILGTTLETVPAKVPYLAADPALEESWRRDLGHGGDLKIGITWQGSATFAGDRMRSAPLRHFAPLARVPSARLFSLQKGPARDQICAVAREFTVIDLGSTLDEGGGAFLDTAAVMMNLDLVITTDTSIAHLAGALGVPVWVALAVGADWRWLHEREDSPWYPSMRLFRQKWLHDWDEVFERMASALCGKLRPPLSGGRQPPEPARAQEANAPPSATPSRVPAPPRATVCILTFGDYLPYFRRCLDSVVRYTPPGRIELRLGFNEAPASLEYACKACPPTGDVADWETRSGGLRRRSYVTREGMAVRLWDSPTNLYKEPMARLLFHDLPLTTDYVIWLDDDSYVEDGWWQVLCPLFDRGVDYIGQSWWVDYLPGQDQMIRSQPWYRSVPLEHRDGRPGVWFMTGGFMVLRSERLRESNFPDTLQAWKGETLKQYGGDTLLGEIAHQLSWTRAVHDAHLKINVDLEGRFPAPRRSGPGRQFGSDADVAVQ